MARLTLTAERSVAGVNLAINLSVGVLAVEIFFRGIGHALNKFNLRRVVAFVFVFILHVFNKTKGKF